MKNISKKKILIIAGIVVLCIIAIFVMRKLTAKETKVMTLSEQIDNNEVTFGYYKNKLIKWKVLEKDNKYHRALLFCVDSIDYDISSNNPEDKKWSSSDLRDYLNGDFCYSAFSDMEKISIIETPIENKANVILGTDAGPNTIDKIFVLGSEDVRKYLSINSKKEYYEVYGNGIHPAMWVKYNKDVVLDNNFIVIKEKTSELADKRLQSMTDANFDTAPIMMDVKNESNLLVEVIANVSNDNNWIKAEWNDEGSCWRAISNYKITNNDDKAVFLQKVNKYILNMHKNHEENDINNHNDGNKVIAEIDDYDYSKPPIYDNSQIVISNDDIKSAKGKKTKDNYGETHFVIDIKLNDEGKEKFGKATKRNIGMPIYIIADNDIISAPYVQSVITDGMVQITGMDDLEAAKNLAKEIINKTKTIHFVEGELRFPKLSGELDFIRMHNCVVDSIKSIGDLASKIEDYKLDISGDNQNKEIFVTATCKNDITTEEVNLLLTGINIIIGKNAYDQTSYYSAPEIDSNGNYKTLGSLFDEYSVKLNINDQDGSILGNIVINDSSYIPHSKDISALNNINVVQYPKLVIDENNDGHEVKKGFVYDAQ